MRRSLFLCILSTIILTGCGNDSNNWTVEDFAIYDDEGELINYALDEEISLLEYQEEGIECQTLKKVKISDVAKVALADYDFTDFYCTVTSFPTDFRSDKEEEINAEYLSKYPNINEAVKHTNELSNDELNLFLSAEFYYDKEKDKLIKWS